MRSSTSSSEGLADPGADGPADGAAREPHARQSTDRYARETAADRPGVAQPVPIRPVPDQPWGRIMLGAAALLVLLLGGWEFHWRAYGVQPSIANTLGLWAIQRRRIDAGEGDATVLLGSSRLLFGVQLPTWERLDGRRPIQLSFEGTSPITAAEDLAADPNFTGRLIVGIAPDTFFSGFAYRGDAARYAHKESPSQRISQWLSMRFIEPYLAFDDPDYALQTVLKRLPWPARPGRHWGISVRKLANSEADRNSYLWDKVSENPEYRALARRIWQQDFQPSPDDPSQEELLRTEKEQIARMVGAVQKLRMHGAKVLFVRMPSSGEYLAYEDREYPRKRSWDALLAATGSPGIYFEDYPELQGYYLPEWSHLTRSEAQRFTAALHGIVARDVWKASGTSPAGPTSASIR